MSAPAPTRRDLVARPLAALLAVLLGLGATAAVLAWAGGIAEPLPGLPDPGPLTAWGLPLATYATQVAAVVVVSCLLAPLLTATKLRDPLTPRAAAATRWVRWVSALWLLLTLAVIWLSTSDLYALPAARVGAGDVSTYLSDTTQGQALSVQAVMLLVLLVASLAITTAWRSTLALLLALASLVPALVTGHSASSGSHSTAVVAIGFHVLAAVVWIGGVLALWWHLAGDEEVRARAARRFSSLAAWCLGLTAFSGLLSAYVRLDGVSGFVSSDYGRAALVKVLILVAVGLVAARLRRIVRGATGTPAWRSFATLSGIELVALTVALGIGVALSRTPPPVGEPYTSLAESLVGGPLPPAPTLARMLTTVQLSGFGLAVLCLGTAGYVVGLRVLRRRGDRWPLGRTVAWFAGLLVVAYATMGGLGVYSHIMFSVHMTSHMALSMLAPVLLVLGAPITLALRALPGPDSPGGDGPRQLLVAFLNSRWSRIVTHPAFATIVFVGSLYVIYFTGIYDWLMSNHLGHTLMELHFLLAGFLYYEVLIGAAPLPRRLPHLGRLGLLILVAPFHAFFAISVMTTTEVIGRSYYTLLERPYASDLLADQNLAGGLTWALGEIPLLGVAIVLLAQWFRDDTRQARQRDRRAARDGDAELVAYNEMLQRIANDSSHRGERDPATRGQKNV